SQRCGQDLAFQRHLTRLSSGEGDGPLPRWRPAQAAPLPDRRCRDRPHLPEPGSVREPERARERAHRAASPDALRHSAGRALPGFCPARGTQPSCCRDGGAGVRRHRRHGPPAGANPPLRHAEARRAGTGAGDATAIAAAGRTGGGDGHRGARRDRHPDPAHARARLLHRAGGARHGHGDAGRPARSGPRFRQGDRPGHAWRGAAWRAGDQSLSRRPAGGGGGCMTTFYQLLFSGFALGCVYALVALGFTVIYRSSQVINFAQGSLLALGAYMVSWFAIDKSLPFGLAVLAAIGVCVLVGVVFQRLVLRWVAGQPVFVIVMITIGLSIVIDASVSAKFGANPRLLGDPWSSSAV